MDKEAALGHLTRALERAPKTDVLGDDPASRSWYRSVRVALEHIFGEDSKEFAEFQQVGLSDVRSEDDAIARDVDQELFYRYAYARGLSEVKDLLQSYIDQVREYWSEEGRERVDRRSTRTHEVFLVHGRDEGIKAQVARFLEGRGLKLIILEEVANRGRTIIEKFDAGAEVDYAIVLMTEDDTGGLRGEDPRPRARQNVIFELGFFVGKIGRGRVCLLKKGNPEVPVDYAGVVYIPMDGSSQWQMKLLEELKEAGLDVTV